MYRKKLIIFILTFIFIAAKPQHNEYLNDTTFNQKVTESSWQQANDDTLYRKIQELERQLQQLESKMLQAESESEMSKLLEEASRLKIKPEEDKIDVSKKYFSGVRQQQGLNPNISFGADFFAGYSSANNKNLNETSEISYGNNGFYLREAELSLVAPLDPFTRGKGFIEASPEGVKIDEVYLEWLNLPLNMNLKTGIFYPEFGLLNRYHDHALPQFDRPRALINQFGTGGLSGPGISANFLIPPWGFSDASSLDFSLLIGNNSQSFMNKPDHGFIYTLQFLDYFDLSASSYLEFRISGAAGQNDNPGGINNSYIGSGAVTYKWAPVGREKYRTIDWKNEFLYSIQECDSINHRSLGFYSSFQNKINARFWISGRIGYSQLPGDPKQDEWDFTIALDFWQSEFVFTRLQYQYNQRSISHREDFTGSFPSDHAIIIQVVWAMGPHKHEAY